jgi:hypothetical protein
MTATSRWAVRLIVLGAFVLTVWLCGPRAAAVLAARLASAEPRGPMIALDRVGIGERPAWLDAELLVAISASLSPWLSGEVGLLDEPEARRLRDGLKTVPWVEDVALARAFPDRLRLRVGLRRPVLAVRAADGTGLCLVDHGAVMLPWVDTPLPVVRLYHEGGRPSMTVAPGERCDERRVRAAARIACEWRDELAPLVLDCPPLLEVDTTNLGERWVVGPDYPEIRVTLQRSDGAEVVFGYGRPVDSPLPRVPVRAKAAVLGNVLARHAQLEGLVAGDLRFQRRWAEYLQPRRPGARDPFEPWKAWQQPVVGR